MAEIVPLLPEPSAEPATAAGPTQPGTGDLALAEAVARAALGAVAITLGAGASIVRRAAGVGEPHGPRDDRTPQVAGAALGFASEALRTAASLADAATRVLRPLIAAGAGATEPIRRTGEEMLRHWGGSWERARPETEALAAAVAAETTRRAVTAIVDQLDLTDLVLERVNVDRVVAAIDLDAVVARVDVDAVADRLDIERLIARLDLSALALEVIERIDLPEIIRASTAAVGSETVRTVRMDAVAADDAVARFVGRLLRRESRGGDG